MNKGENLCIGIAFECFTDLFWVDRLAHRVVDNDGGSSTAFDILDHTATENAISTHDDFISWAHHVDKTHFHSNRPRTGNRERERIFRLEGISEQFF